MGDPLVKSYPIPNGAATTTYPYGIDAPQTLTASYAVVGSQFSLAEASQIALDVEYVPAQDGRNLSFFLEVSSDSMETAESSSKWYPFGAQTDAGGTLTAEPRTYAVPGGTPHATQDPVPLEIATIHQKARIKAKEDGASSFGTVQFRINKLPLVAAS